MMMIPPSNEFASVEQIEDQMAAYIKAEKELATKENCPVCSKKLEVNESNRYCYEHGSYEIDYKHGKYQVVWYRE